MGFLFPELLLFALPGALAWWTLRGTDRATAGIRLAVLLLLVLAAAGPYLETSSDGRDLVVLVDRSRSMPPGSDRTALELVKNAEDARRSGDRVAVVAFGGRAVIESMPAADGRFGGFALDPLADGTDLGTALETALNLVPEGRAATILVVSDGENHGRDALDLARRALARGVRIDVRPEERPHGADLSVERVDLPDDVAVGEPFQFTVWVRADARAEHDFTLERGADELSSGRRVFEQGLNRLVFRDVLDAAGVAQYAVRVGETGDRVPENNRGAGAVLARGARAVLVVNDDGAEDSLVQALRAARIPTSVSAPESAPLDPVGLTAYRAVVLENVAAARVQHGMEGLSDFVLERGGGLFLTGGKASFGNGGYFLSKLDELLPVSMEMRQENRKIGVALSIVMDRSGSMSAPVAGGLTKMDLANLGAAAAIELLSPIDSVGVIAVDSTEHRVLPLAPVTDAAELARSVRRVTSGGGGIYVYTGLVAAARMLDEAEQKNRHITLFSDAADSEEQGGCLELAEKLLSMGVTISVIALGSLADVDADFLVELAKAGQGDVYFTQDPADLPRLFAQDTLRAARATFVEQETATRVLPDLLGLGEVAAQGFPALEAYNLTYLRTGALAGVVTHDENQAPVFSFVYQGLGRTAAYTGQIGGTHGRSVVAWPEFGTFFVTVARWLLGQEEPGEFFTSVRREGREAVIAVEVDPEAGTPPDTSALSARVRDPRGALRDLVLERVGENRYEARYSLDTDGVSLATVRLGGDRFVSVPPIALPYSPEFERSPDPERGARLLRELALETGGSVDPTATALFEGARGGRAWRVVARELVLLALVLFVAEVAGRRLALWGSLRLPPSLARRVRRAASRARAAVAAPRAPVAQTAAPDEVEAEPAVPPPEPEGLESALGRARRAAERKLDR